jgi:hypothetical protein
MVVIIIMVTVNILNTNIELQKIVHFILDYISRYRSGIYCDALSTAVLSIACDRK